MPAGAPRDERIGSYNQEVGVRLDIDDAIYILTPHDVPLQQLLGSEAATQPKVEWLEEDLTPQEVTAVDVSSVTSGTGTLEVNDASIVRKGDVLLERNGSDYKLQWLVTAVDTDNDEIDIAPFGGNTNTSPTASATLEIIGQYRDEGGDPEDPRSIERRTKYNVTQIGQEQVSVTRTGRKRGLYGQGDPYDHEVMKKFKELAIRFERSMVNGYRTESVDAKKRMMGGLFYYISTNTESGTKSNVASLVNSLMKKCYEKGGTPRTLMVSPAVKVAISGIDANLRRVTRDDRTAGAVVERVLTDFGEVDIVVNRHFPKTKGILMQTEFIKKRPFDAYFHELLAKTGDSESGHIVGEYSLEVKNEEAHGLLTVSDA